LLDIQREIFNQYILAQHYKILNGLNIGRVISQSVTLVTKKLIPLLQQTKLSVPEKSYLLCNSLDIMVTAKQTDD